MFGKRVTLFKLFGFEVRIDASWLLLAFLVTWSLGKGYFPSEHKGLETSTYWLMGVFGALGLFVSLLLHEMSHSVVARSYGIPIRGITLFIFGGVAELDEEPKSAKAEFWMAIAGPIASAILAALFYALAKWGQQQGLAVTFTAVLDYLALANLVLAVFNLFPGFPLDGGRILRAALWGLKGDLKWATQVAVKGGTVLATVMMILGVVQFLAGNIVGGIWWFVISLFLRAAAQSSLYQMWLNESLKGESVAVFAQQKPVVVSPDWTLDQVVSELVYKTYHKMYPVVDRQGDLLGSLSTAEIKQVPSDKWGQTLVDDVYQRLSSANSLNSTVPAFDALKLMNQSSRSRLLVVKDGDLFGIVTLKDLMAYLTTRMEFEELQPSSQPAHLQRR